MIPESFIEELKYRCGIEEIVAPYTRLKRTGKNLKGICPFHSEKSASFTVYPENGSYYCFGCGAGGDVVTFVKQAEHLDYIEALKFLAQKAGMPFPEDVQDDETSKLKMRILEINREAARFFYDTLISPEGRVGLDYLRQRQLSDKTIRTFGLGYAPNSWDSLKKHLLQKGYKLNELITAQVIKESKSGGYDTFRDRVIFPIIDLKGTVIGFGGRAFGDIKPKYLNSSDTLVFKKSRGLFGLNRAKSTKEPQLILTEGYMDTIAVHQAGLDNAVATLGTALTSEQARLIASYTSEVVIAYDSDVAGRKATARANELLAQVGVKVKVLTLQGAKDPDEYIKQNGILKFKELISSSANATEYKISNIAKKYDLATSDGKVSFLKEFCSLMADVESKIECDIYIGKIAGETGANKETLFSQVESIRRKKRSAQMKKFEENLKVGSNQNPLMKRDLEYTKLYKYAQAEDKLIAILMKNPDYVVKITNKITHEQFVTNNNKEIFKVLCYRLQNGQSIDVTHLSGEFENQQMSKITGLLATNGGINSSIEAAYEYIDAILSIKDDRKDSDIGIMKDDDWKDYISGLSAKKH